jgi:hypothetical protein
MAILHCHAQNRRPQNEGRDLGQGCDSLTRRGGVAAPEPLSIPLPNTTIAAIGTTNASVAATINKMPSWS